MHASLRIFPRSLQGQMLLAVALALLVAQVIAGVFLYRAATAHGEAEVVNTLAFQLIADVRNPRSQWRAEADRRRGGFVERRRALAISLLDEGTRQRRERAPDREQALADVLRSQGVAVAEVIVLAPITPTERQRLRGGRPGNGTSIVLAGLREIPAGDWRIAAHELPRFTGNPLRGVLVQTVILYIVLVGGLALLLRRITRPLALLTTRVEQFGGSTDGAPPLAPSGPDDTRRLIVAHNAMEARIAALLDEKDVMLGAIGHDLKTPLTALRVRIESVEDEGERARMAATIEDITRSLDDILSLARVGRPSDPLERTDLGALVASVVEEFEDLGEAVALETTEKIALPLRATWLRRALRNLIGNALRYGNDARIRVSREGEAPRQWAVIRILDSGPGISECQIATMLEPFQRGEASRNRETGGAGLGLTLARAIADQHGGTLHLANKLGDSGAVEGLVAELRLPL
ncbi:two-component sensor histidine kinase [Erythrobacter arachoides]|uniref:histidine kinase n=1 Tax=Aurantiacibacter arachoides TaxID=1850444 RepID=A0A844ZYL1_9SPHN|nr:ATP-binding protein [Aurantiacibacter arachoides]MXO92026.1 two-component sensor histidine kinase [Aurantiacibacter arachoides]GGD60333.1 hypothetical protein GCM10011411_20640 [Aurantiacibacter arachoides]